MANEILTLNNNDYEFELNHLHSIIIKSKFNQKAYEYCYELISNSTVFSDNYKYPNCYFYYYQKTDLICYYHKAIIDSSSECYTILCFDKKIVNHVYDKFDCDYIEFVKIIGYLFKVLLNKHIDKFKSFYMVMNNQILDEYFNIKC